MPTEMKEQLEQARTAAAVAADEDEQPLVNAQSATASLEVPIAKAASQGATQLDEVAVPKVPASWTDTEQALQALAELADASAAADGAAAAPTDDAAGGGDLDAKAGGRGAKKKGCSVAPEKVTAKRQKKGN